MKTKGLLLVGVRRGCEDGDDVRKRRMRNMSGPRAQAPRVASHYSLYCQRSFVRQRDGRKWN